MKRKQSPGPPMEIKKPKPDDGGHDDAANGGGSFLAPQNMIRPAFMVAQRPIFSNMPTINVRPLIGNHINVARPLMGGASIRPMRPVTGNDLDVQHRIAMARDARERALAQKEEQKQTKLEESIFKADKEKSKGGLNVAHHPSLMMDTAKVLSDARFKFRSGFVAPPPTRGMDALLLERKEQKPKINPYLPDPMDRVRGAISGSNIRPARSFKFAVPGKYIEIAERQRAEENLQILRQEVAAEVKLTGLQKELELVSDVGMRTKAPPKCEWWDKALVNSSYETFNIKAHNPVVQQLVTSLVHHPIPIEPPFSDNAEPLRPLMLTAKEQKKLRKQTRAETLKDKRDRMRLGLIPEDQPRLTKSNFMRVLGHEAILAPSQIEQQVAQQIADRQAKHQELIDSQKLTPDERREKKRLQLLEDTTSSVVSVCVFIITDLSHAQHKFKVTQNATQYNLTGAGLCLPDLNIVIVEGGPKGIKAYKKLLLGRIKWDQYSGVPNTCTLVWEGAVQTQSFRGFRLKNYPTDDYALMFLEKHNGQAYWTAAKNYVVETY